MNKPIRLFLVLITLTCLGSSCKKLVEDKKRDLLLQAMTDGMWHIETFQEGSLTTTEQFLGYNFKFQEDGTVDGIKDSVAEKGTWVGDIQNYSIMSDFPNALDPLKKLNGTWKITDAQTGFVVAEMNSSGGKDILHLRKNP